MTAADAAGAAGFPHRQLDRPRLPDEAVLRRFDNLDAAVEFAVGAGQQCVHWCFKAERLS